MTLTCKQEAARLYVALDAAYRSQSCGWQLCDHMGLAGVYKLKTELRAAWAQVKALDPNAPDLPDWAR